MRAASAASVGDKPKARQRARCELVQIPFR